MDDSTLPLVGLSPVAGCPVKACVDEGMLSWDAGVLVLREVEGRLGVAGRLAGLPDDLGQPDTLLADAGYVSEANVEACAQAGIDPLIAPGREAHRPAMDERFAPAPPAPEEPTPLDAMLHRLKTPEGRALYAKRKHTPEPVFGILKSVLGYRQFSLRGLAGGRGEWSLVTMAWNVKRMFNLSQAAAQGRNRARQGTTRHARRTIGRGAPNRGPPPPLSS